MKPAVWHGMTRRVRSYRFFIPLFAGAASLLGIAFTTLLSFENGISDTALGLVRMVNLFNVLLGGEGIVISNETNTDRPAIFAFLFALCALFCFWWAVRELVLRFHERSTHVGIEI